jgi:hypothetical protein
MDRQDDGRIAAEVNGFAVPEREAKRDVARYAFHSRKQFVPQ